MPDPWFVVLDATGECVSMGQRVASPLPGNLVSLPISEDEANRFLAGMARWDAATHSFVAVSPPPPDVTVDQIRAWLSSVMGMTNGEIEDAFRQAAGLT